MNFFLETPFLYLLLFRNFFSEHMGISNIIFLSFLPSNSEMMTSSYRNNSSRWVWSCFCSLLCKLPPPPSCLSSINSHHNFSTLSFLRPGHRRTILGAVFCTSFLSFFFFVERNRPYFVATLRIGSNSPFL